MRNVTFGSLMDFAASIAVAELSIARRLTHRGLKSLVNTPIEQPTSSADAYLSLVRDPNVA